MRTLLILAALLLSLPQVQAKTIPRRTLSDQDVREAYQTCVMITKASPAKLKAIWDKVQRFPYTRGIDRSPAVMRARCVDYVGRGLGRLLNSNREMNDYYAQRGKYAPRRGGNDGGYVGPAGDGPVNCFTKFLSCTGPSTRADRPSQCPSGTESFSYEWGPHGCHQ